MLGRNNQSLEYKKIEKEKIPRLILFSEQEIGKATINTEIEKKDNAQKREKQDEQELHQEIKRNI